MCNVLLSARLNVLDLDDLKGMNTIAFNKIINYLLSRKIILRRNNFDNLYFEVVYSISLPFTLSNLLSTLRIGRAIL